MAQDSTQVVVAGTGHIWSAATGTTLPTNATAAMTAVSTAYTDIGYTDDNGVTFSIAFNTTDINAWQVADPVRILRTSRTQTVKFNLIQFTPANVQLALAGGTVATTSFTEATDVTAAQTTTCVVDAVDGSNTYRMVFQKVQVQNSLDIAINAQSAVTLPVEFRVLAGTVAIYSNATAWS